MDFKKKEISKKTLSLVIICGLILSGIFGSITGAFIKKAVMENKYEYYDELIENELSNYLVNLMKNFPLPIKLKIYFEFIRQLDFQLTKKMDFYVKIILHDSAQYNYYQDYSSMFDEFWETNNSMTEVELCFQSLSSWNYYYQNLNLLASKIHNKVSELCDYKYDNMMIYGILPHWEYFDYTQFPYETAFTFSGDCEDQAILDAMLLESCGYETIIANVHDDDQNRTGRESGLHHGFLWVKVNPEDNWSARLWRFGEGEYEWLLLDPTWNISFGSTITWVDDYNKLNFTDWGEIFSWGVVCQPNDLSIEMNNFSPEQEQII